MLLKAEGFFEVEFSKLISKGFELPVSLPQTSEKETNIKPGNANLCFGEVLKALKERYFEA